MDNKTSGASCLFPVVTESSAFEENVVTIMIMKKCFALMVMLIKKYTVVH